MIAYIVSYFHKLYTEYLLQTKLNKSGMLRSESDWLFR